MARAFTTLAKTEGGFSDPGVLIWLDAPLGTDGYNYSNLVASTGNFTIGYSMLRRLKLLVLLVSLVIGGLLNSSVGLCQTVAYTDATIETMGPGGQIKNGTLVVQDGLIVDIGTDVKIPDDARVVSMVNKTIMPGLIDPYFVFPITTSSATAGNTRTIVIGGRTIRIGAVRPTGPGAFINLGEYFYPYKFNFSPSLRSGITVANLVSSGRGRSAFANLTDHPTPEMLFQTEGFLFARVTNDTSSLDLIRKPLATKPKSTTTKPKSTTTSRPSRRGGASGTAARSTSSGPSAADKTKALWTSVREGKSPLFVNVNNAASVAHVLQIAKGHEKLRLVLVATGANLFPSLDEIEANKNVTVVLQPGIDTVPFTSDLMNVSRMLAEREIPFVLSMSLSTSQMATMQDDPMFPVAILVKTGLDRETALKNITIKPAELLGIDKSHGSLEKNKKANFLVFDGDPLQTGSRLLQVILNGKKIHEN